MFSMMCAFLVLSLVPSLVHSLVPPPRAPPRAHARASLVPGMNPAPVDRRPISNYPCPTHAASARHLN